MPRKEDFDPIAITALLQRAFPGSASRFERTQAGVSTQVYRVWHGDEIFYLRLAETPEASLQPEVQIHTELVQRGARVPRVIYFEEFDPIIERSAMITAEIRGEPLEAATPEILRAAGRDLAQINQLPVEGFGWVRRDQPESGRLEAEHATLKDFSIEYLESAQALLRAQVFSSAETATIRELIEGVATASPNEQAWLAHDDFDVSHIFQDGGHYSGIIDFGEVRGAQRWYDLGHFRLHDGERLNVPGIGWLLEGYKEITALPDDADWLIGASALMIGVRALARLLSRPASEYQRFLDQALRGVVSELAKL